MSGAFAPDAPGTSPLEVARAEQFPESHLHRLAIAARDAVSALQPFMAALARLASST